MNWLKHSLVLSYSHQLINELTYTVLVSENNCSNCCYCPGLWQWNCRTAHGGSFPRHRRGIVSHLIVTAWLQLLALPRLAGLCLALACCLIHTAAWVWGTLGPTELWGSWPETLLSAPGARVGASAAHYPCVLPRPCLCWEAYPSCAGILSLGGLGVCWASMDLCGKGLVPVCPFLLGFSVWFL